ncbi:MAG: hypothetical protein H7Y13_02270 [Sphingobacteriaceae bacterium]|nr:hypothetical protein [Sphingobacteriaceae bacterium]
MTKTLTQIAAGTIGFVGTVADSAAQTVTDAVSQAPAALENPNTYVKGLIVSGAIQIIMKLIDKWSENRKARKAAKAATKTL